MWLVQILQELDLRAVGQKLKEVGCTGQFRLQNALNLAELARRTSNGIQRSYILEIRLSPAMS